MKQVLLIPLLALTISVNQGQTPKRVAVALDSEIKLSNLYDPATGIYYEPVYLDTSAYDLRNAHLSTANGVTVAFLDTGILHHHPIFKNLKVVDVDFTGRGSEDDNGHGTTMLLLYLSTTPLPGQTILNVRVLGTDGTGPPETIEKGMQWAVDHGAQVLNMSLGVPQVVAQDLCDYADRLATERGVIIVAAVGNDPTLKMCPAAAKEVISSGARGLAAPMEPVIYAPGTITFEKLPTESGGSSTSSAFPLSEFAGRYLKAYEASDFISTRIIANSDRATTQKFIERLLFGSRSAYQHDDCELSISDAAVMYRISYETGDLEHAATGLNELGVGLQCAGQLQNAFAIYKSAVILHRTARDPAGEEVTLSNMGELQEQLGLHQEAEKTLEASLDLARDARVKDEEGEVTIIGNLCTVHYSLGEVQAAIRDCGEALSKAEARKLYFLQGRDSLNLGTIYQETGDNSHARSYLTQAVELCTKNGDQQGMEIAKRKLAALPH